MILFTMFLLATVVVTGVLGVSIYGYSQEFPLDWQDKTAFLLTLFCFLYATASLVGLVTHP